MPSALSGKEDSGRCAPSSMGPQGGHSGKIKILQGNLVNKIITGLKKLKGVFWVYRVVNGEERPKSRRSASA